MTDLEMFAATPWAYSCPDGIQADCYTAAELEQAWEAMQARVRELEGALSNEECDAEYWKWQAKSAIATLRGVERLTSGGCRIAPCHVGGFWIYDHNHRSVGSGETVIAAVSDWVARNPEVPHE